MELKPGYRQTEVGVIPEEWEVRCIKDIAPLQRGFDLPTSRIRQGPYPVVYSNGVLNHHSHFMVKGPGVVTGRSGTIGNVHFVEEDFWPHNTSLWVTSFKGNDRKFVYYLLPTIRIDRFSTGSGVPTLNRNDVHKHRVAIPPSVEEQRAIAGALGDVDALLRALTQLIAKKRDLKQAAMQQLLTDQTRLPGFSWEWEVKRLGEIGVFRGGNGFPTRYQGKLEGDYPFFKVSDMNNQGNATFMVNSNNWICEAVRREVGANVLPRHSIVFAKIGAAIFLERKKILSRDSCIDNNMMGFVFNEAEWHCAFIHCLFLTIQLGKLVSTTALPSLNGNELAELQFAIPKLKEQTAIAAVLSDMDAELAALEQRLAKTRALKQGMMQELLTGRTRLV